LRLNGLAYEFVILNDHGVTYFQELQEELQRQVRTTGSHSWLNKRGGIFILRSDLTPESDRAHIQAVARVSLSAELPLSDQIDRKFTVDRIPALLPVTQRKKEHRVHELPLPRLQFFNEFGGFSEDGREYVISLSAGQWTPAPWINVIANRREFGFQVSECGLPHGRMILYPTRRAKSFISVMRRAAKCGPQRPYRSGAILVISFGMESDIPFSSTRVTASIIH
jgi:cyclic beta-1,2-glucan synthetase